jgi:hypothetical protein
MAANTTRSFYRPDGELTDKLVLDILGLACESPDPAAVAVWCPLEREVVVDYALREHLSASDNPAHRRPRPSLLGPRRV